MTSTDSKPLSLSQLTALVVTSIIGGGIFALPQNLAAHASLGAIFIGWGITGIGVFALAMVFRHLALSRPELVDGIYSYPREGFGRYVGFNSAWGYWLGAFIGNVSFAVLLFGALGYFFPIFGNGANPASIIGATLLLWFFHFLILRSVRQTFIINFLATIFKLVPILLFIVLVWIGFNLKTFHIDFWGAHLGSVFSQVKSTMLVTLWIFIGIEGAAVESSRAKHQREVGRATLLGLGLTFIIYMLISVLSFGIVPQSVLATAHNPSMAFVLSQAVGPWGADIVNIGVILSLLGAWLGWTLLAAQLPFDAAKDHAMPKFLTKTDEKDIPISSLWLTSAVTQVVFILMLFSDQTYITLAELATSCVLLPYLFCALFSLLKVKGGKLFAISATLYSAWLIYAGGMHYLMLSSLLYVVGLIFYVWARKERKQPIFTRLEFVLASVFVVTASWAIIDFIFKR